MRLPATLLALAPTLLLSATPALRAQTLDPPPLEASSSSVAAQARFDEGRRRFAAGDFANALSEFRASLALYRSPNTRLYVGLCLQRMGDAAEAWAELQRTHTEATDLARTDPRYAAARDISRREMTALEPRIARVTLHVPQVPAGLRVRVGDTDVPPAAFGVPLPFDPGNVRLTAEAPGYETFTQDLRLSPGSAAALDVALRPGGAAPRPPVTVRVGDPTAPPVGEPVTVSRGGGVRVAGFVIAGVGVAALGAFAALGVVAGQQYDDLVARCGNRCTSRDVSDIDAGAQAQLLANVSLGVGAAAVIAGVVMIAVGGPRREVLEPAPRASINPFVDPSRGTFGVTGAF